MVKSLTIYKCEICDSKYDSFDNAYNCESQEIDKPLAKVGDVVDYFKEGIPDWDDCDTHLTDLVIMDIKPNEYNPHHLEYVLGWMSDSGNLIHDVHAQADNNAEFEKYCTIKTEL